ncbi:copper amine oxidase N-terminal domain-containing protein [Paenibacillus glycinis]|uniref:Copper amine oxidase-like N-terminal domain-containing protein n=1 Tax=Paenibacillus glycinis TaxID=2697035 RepID=A0ABW9XV66_9BACL|nr:copper amine oxidase N-terminal domain-containing protein [Paenibacillus glycinis]NBD26524.1 hypothetical protein [Paenibacillus glycinis]
MKRNRMMTAVLAAAVLAGSMIGGASAFADTPRIVSSNMPIKLLFDARQLTTDVAPVNEDGTILVPIRFVSDKLGGKLTLTGKLINIVKGSNTLNLTIGASTATVNGKTITLSVPVRAVSGRTMVPLRVVSEGLGVAVKWDVINKFVWIGSQDVPKIHDFKKPGDIKPFLPYFKGAPEYLLNGGYGRYTNATEIEINDFPFRDGVNTFYRMDLAYDQDNNVYLQTIENTPAVMNGDFYFLSRNSSPIGSLALTYLRQIPTKGIHIYYNNTSKLGGKMSDLSKVDYIDFCNTINLGNGNSTQIFIKNPWR